jgi:mannose-6-phosphate isomerase-like protein (cupin superfamily)
MPSQMDAVVSRARASLATAGLTVAGEDLARPWGGFLLISQTDIRGFIQAYFSDTGMQEAGEHPALSPKLLLVAPGQRLSWQYHRRRSEIWRIVEWPVGISRSLTDEETPMRSYAPGEVLRLELGERHRLIGLETWGVVAEIWQHTDAASPSDELDIVRVAVDPLHRRLRSHLNRKQHKEDAVPGRLRNPPQFTLRRSSLGGAASHLSGLALYGSVPRLQRTYAQARRTARPPVATTTHRLGKT